MRSNNLILCHPYLLPSVFPSIKVFSSELAVRIRWPKYGSFSLSISPSNECSRLISFRIDWLDHLAVKGTLKSLLQNHNSKTSILQCSAFFIVQLSHPLGFPCGSAGKESACNEGDLDSIPGSRRSPGEGMATHSSILAWRMDRGQRSLAGYSLWCPKESDMTE